MTCQIICNHHNKVDNHLPQEDKFVPFHYQHLNYNILTSWSRGIQLAMTINGQRHEMLLNDPSQSTL